MFGVDNMQLAYLLCVLVAVSAAPKSDDCEASITTVSGSHAPTGTLCSGQLIFEENFDELDFKVWEHEKTLAGGGNWEFEYYTNNRSSSFVEDGNLHIRPVLLTEETGEEFLNTGTMDVNGGAPADECTDPQFYGCIRTGTNDNYVNPIKSARIRTVNSFSFKYGTVIARAKMPAGDWLWPAIWLLPRDNTYGSWPASGEIDLVEIRGNKNLINSNGVNVGTQQMGSTVHWGPYVGNNQFMKTHWEQNNEAGYDTDFHTYKVVWTSDSFTFYVDDQQIGTTTVPDGGFWEFGGFDQLNIDNPWEHGTKMAPFDEDFYVIINLAVGGTGYFDDSFINPGGKPWLNTSPTAIKDFWLGKSQWLPTWNKGDTDLVVDYVRIYAI